MVGGRVLWTTARSQPVPPTKVLPSADLSRQERAAARIRFRGLHSDRQLDLLHRIACAVRVQVVSR